MGCDILVDGYNVIKKNSMFQMLETRNLAVARDTLIKQLKNRYRHTTFRVIVVFDGNGPREQVYHDEHIRIVFSRQGETADRVLARLAAEARASGREILVYSDDIEVQQSVIEQGGKKRTTQHLTKYLNAAPQDVETRARHRQAVRHDYGLDPTSKWKDDDEIPPITRRKKGKKSRKYR
jgi:predicted RNA-binding protein with PIN domain